MAGINQYPEYIQEAWNWPIGYMMNDQRHKARVFASFLLPANARFGDFSLGVAQRFDSGTPYDIAFSLNPRAYVTNPGYITTPSSVTYYISGRGPLRTDNTFNTDLSFVWSRRIRGPVEVFFRALVYNVFNQQGVMSVDTTGFLECVAWVVHRREPAGLRSIHDDAGCGRQLQVRPVVRAADCPEQLPGLAVL